MALGNLFNEWMVFSLILLGIWLIIFLSRKIIRKEMLAVSFLTAPLGLTEPLFVPEYWNPPSLFNLATTTGFDIESLIFSFAVGGIASVIYQGIFNLKNLKINKQEIHSKKHRYHLLAILSPFIIFLVLAFFSEINPIYSSIIAMFLGGIATILCRPDLKKKVLYSGLIFLAIYFVFFLSFNIIYPWAVERFWNLSAISGILILRIPLEELLFAFTLGMIWGSIYEHVKWYKLK